MAASPVTQSQLLSNVSIWIGIACCIAQSAIFSGLNLAIFSISKLRLEVEAGGGNRDAVALLALRRDSNLTLATVLWGNVTINVLLTLLSDSVLAGVGAFIFSTIIITLFGEIIPQKRGHALTPVFTPSASRAYRLGLLTDNKASRCSVNNRKLDSKADSASTASKVGAPAARRRAIRLFCSATIFCASQRDVGPERGDRRPP